MSRELKLDAVVIGAGVAGLWTANALQAKGRSVILLSNSPLGAGQTLAAQGVIHGGLKYAVGGKLNDSSEALAAMPERWWQALQGRGDIDLSRVKVLSDCQYLWSLPGVLSKAISLFGSKAMRGRAQSVSREDFPEIFRSPEYKGQLFRVDERVVDPVSLVEELARPDTKFDFSGELGRGSGVVEIRRRNFANSTG